ncbi:ABC transporter ATP-binding protein [Kineococcus endophyticus]|uniref:ABC transporter ATP-binding protein n=1 Tax=Kineococcus endophyticus TaxID=1181883 RepID=A0ABV3PDT8_9ACTN
MAITGPSGAGKSTLLNIIGLLDTPSSGLYCINGQDVSALTTRAKDNLRSRVFGFVFQSSYLLASRTVAANVSLGLAIQGLPRRERVPRVKEALEIVGVGHRWDALGKDLSGGERQRVALARALATRPQIVLADEPTGNLDSENTENVIDLFGRIHASGVTLVVITHTAAVAEAASREVRILDGRMTDLEEKTR